MRALYRKYRPTTLDALIGEPAVVKALKSALESGHFSHAYLFTGPRGCGKTSAARIFAHAVNNFPYTVEDSYPDIIEIDAASNTGVDHIRDLREKAIIAPTVGPYKIYIIDEVHMLSKSAFNALLKILEEPPAHVIFILATTDFYKVPVTIVSRVQKLEFQLAPPETMTAFLTDIAKREQINIDSDALALIVDHGGGSFRDSLSLLDQLSTLSSHITHQTVVDALGLPETAVISDLLSAYQQGNIAQITQLLSQLLNAGTRPATIAESLMRRILADPKPELLPLLSKLPDVAGDFPDVKLTLAFLSSNPASPQNQSIPTINPATTPKPTPPPSTKPSFSAPASPKTPPTTEPTSPTTQKSTSTSNRSAPETFSWETFITAVKTSSPLSGSYLEKAEFSLSDHTINISVKTKFHFSILNKASNRAVLDEALPTGFYLNLMPPKGSQTAPEATFSNSADYLPPNAPNALKTAPKPQKAPLYDIMGEIKEVQTDDSPF